MSESNVVQIRKGWEYILEHEGGKLSKAMHDQIAATVVLLCQLEALQIAQQRAAILLGLEKHED